MSPRPRVRSLFWTIAGLFLLAIVLGTLLQVLIAVAVLGPLEARESRSRAEITASSLAAEIAAHDTLAGWSAAEVRSLLDRHRAMLGPGPGVIGYRDGVGWRMTDPPDRGRLLDRVLAGASLREERPGEPPHRELIVRRPVRRGAATVGEVVVVRPVRGRRGPPFGGGSAVLLFVPIALVLSVLVGLWIVRMLVRRLRAMETLAARVAEGDLSVRIGDPSGDEIGRLAERLDRMTERLAEARTRLEAADEQRRQLFADITHELATPLTSIRGYAETLLDPGVPVSEEEHARYVRGVLEESRRLDRLIRDLFELARLEAGAVPLEPERLDWAALARNTVERFTPRFRDAGLALSWSGPVGPVWIEADGHRMEQVLENLLGNALRYVPSGGSVRLSLGPAPGGGRARLVIADDGPGVPADQLGHLFERFYRAEGASHGRAAVRETGSGLGLAIVHEVVARHGGDVRALASSPHGLTVEVDLPLAG